MDHLEKLAYKKMYKKPRHLFREGINEKFNAYYPLKKGRDYRDVFPNNKIFKNKKKTEKHGKNKEKQK